MSVDQGKRNGAIANLATWQRPLRVLVGAGGSGGHIYPAEAIVNALRGVLSASGVPLDVVWAGLASGREQAVASALRAEFHSIKTGKLRRPSLVLEGKYSRVRRVLGYCTRQNLDVLLVPIGALQSLRLILKRRPDVVLATGAYVALPVGFAAYAAGAPLLIHEQTTDLGMANRILARCATLIALTHASSLSRLPKKVHEKVVVTGNPVRLEILTGVSDLATWQGWEPNLPTVLITGGSQGSRQLNDLMEPFIRDLLEVANVLHQCGVANLDDIMARSSNLLASAKGGYEVVGHIDNMGNALALADLVVSRSGAGTITDIRAVGKPSVLVPLMSNIGDQIRNARALVDAGAAIALVGDDATPEALRACVFDLLANPSRLRQMGHAALGDSSASATDQLVDHLLDLATRR